MKKKIQKNQKKFHVFCDFPQNRPKFDHFLDNFFINLRPIYAKKWLKSGSKSGPKNDPKNDPKIPPF